MSTPVNRKYAGQKVLVVYQTPNGKHATELHDSPESADDAVEKWSYLSMEEVCRLNNVTAAAKKPVEDCLAIIDRLSGGSRLADLLSLWLNKRVA